MIQPLPEPLPLPERLPEPEPLSLPDARFVGGSCVLTDDRAQQVGGCEDGHAGLALGQ